MVKELLRGGCAENGINPKAIYDFIKRTEEYDLGVDSFMVIKSGVVVAEAYHNPYTNQTPHVEFSLSKSMAATALGFALAEGKVSLDDSICKFFPEYGKKAYNKNITVRHLVTMTAGKMIGMATSRHKKDWIKIFFDVPPIAPPGKLFLYVNDNFYLISAIVSRVYGETLVDFLYPRLFEPLGIDKPYWETESFGYAAGGFGLYMPIEALARIMVCYSQMGVWEGKQVLPREWVEEATKYQVPTVKKGQTDVTKGYGYGFWRIGMPDAYRAYGLYGQFGYVFEKKDTVLVFNCGIAKDWNLANAITDMCETLWDEPDESYEQPLRELAASLGDKENVIVMPRNTAIEDKINGRPLKTKSTGYASMLVATMSTVFDEFVGNIDLFQFNLKENRDLYMLWREGTFVNEIKLGMNNEYGITEVNYGQLNCHACAKAAWVGRTTLRVLIRMQEACTARQLDFDFSDLNNIRVKNNSIPDLPNLAAYYLDFSGMPLNKTLDDLVVKVVAPAVLMLGEPDFKLKLDENEQTQD